MISMKFKTLAIIVVVFLLAAYSVIWLHEKTLVSSGDVHVVWLRGEDIISNGSNLSSLADDWRGLGFVEREWNGSFNLRIRYVPRALWATSGQCWIRGPFRMRLLLPNYTVSIEHISVRATLIGDGWADEIWPDFSDPDPVIAPQEFEGGPGCYAGGDFSECAEFRAVKTLWGERVRLYLTPSFILLQNGSTCEGSVLFEVRVEYLVRTGFFTSRRDKVVLRLPVKFEIYDLPRPTSKIVVRVGNETTVYPQP
ncbi:hypothetical protein E3E26_08730 [Thermococcus sp. LS1]|uniref:hypothetical protein n=1 Tax=Thermococcus sp. LS1 TaxID=1638259 RepID=UPI00143BBE2A|nr:hypothetical protein [Thermococcus sp. LS1]NJD99862.1 hypothetical protein [Thermococcus sp. LS1]